MHPWFSLCSSLFWELQGKGVVKNFQFCLLSLGVMLQFNISNVGYSDIFCSSSISYFPSTTAFLLYSSSTMAPPPPPPTTTTSPYSFFLSFHQYHHPFYLSHLKFSKIFKINHRSVLIDTLNSM